MQGDNLDKLTIESSAKSKKTSRRFKSSYKIFFMAISLIIVVAVLMSTLSKGKEVDVANVSLLYPAQLISKLNASGYVVAQRKADVASKITGQLISVMVSEGSIVKQGQIIARLENADTQALLEQSRANLNLAKARVDQAKAEYVNADLDLDRKKTLMKSESISRSDLDTAMARYLAAKASLDAADAEVKASQAAVKSAEVSLSYSEIKAPFDAVVLTKNADVGDIITPLGAAAKSKSAVVSIADLSSLMVEADVSEANLSMVQVLQPCDIILDALSGIRFKGVVDTIIPTVDRSKASVLVKIRFLEKDPRILPEMSAKVGFLSQALKPEDQKPRIMLSSSAIRNAGKETFVFKVDEGRARKIQIRTGRIIADMTEVLEGLKAGDMVVVKPTEGIRDGSKIRIRQQ